MAGFLSWIFNRNNRRQGQTYPQTTGSATPRPRTDNRKRTPNAQETGRFAVPRPAEGVTQPGTPPVVPPPLPVDAPALAREAAARQRKKGRSQRASALLGNTGAGAAAPVLNQRTLLGG